MESASELLRRHGVEIDLGDHRTADEIAIALGLRAAIASEMNITGSDPVDLVSVMKKREKGNPYLAF